MDSLSTRVTLSVLLSGKVCLVLLSQLSVHMMFRSIPLTAAAQKRLIFNQKKS